MITKLTPICNESEKSDSDNSIGSWEEILSDLSSDGEEEPQYGAWRWEMQRKRVDEIVETLDLDRAASPAQKLGRRNTIDQTRIREVIAELDSIQMNQLHPTISSRQKLERKNDVWD